MAVTSIGGHKNGQNLKKSPVYSQKIMANKNRHKIVAVFVAFWVSSLSISLSSSPCFPCFSLYVRDRTVSEYCSACVSRVGLSTISKQQNRTRTTLRAVLGQRNYPWKSFEAGCFIGWVLNWESTPNQDFHRLEPHTRPYSNTS